MDRLVNEKKYPIENKWIVKSVWGSAPALLILMLSFFIELLIGRFDPNVLICLAIVPMVTIFIFLQRANYHYSIEDTFITVKQGILFKQQRHIPYGVIQNIFIGQDFSDRLLGLASLIIENAAQGARGQNTTKSNVFGILIQRRQAAEMIGFNGNRISIPGLGKNNAETLKMIILQKMKDNPLEDSQSGL